MTTTQPWVPDYFVVHAVARSSVTFTFTNPAVTLPSSAAIRCKVRRTRFSTTDSISVDGTAGIVVAGNVATVTFSAAQTNLDCGCYTLLLEATIGGQDVALVRGLLDLSASPG